MTCKKQNADITTLLAENLTQARESTGLTQKQLSDLTGIYQSDISRIERGLANPSLITLKRLADGMGLQVQIDFVKSVANKEDITMWANESVFYQIYPLGFCNAPFENDGEEQSRILKVVDWIPHIKKLGANAIYFSPLFESDTHGYNTRDYKKVDCRLGTNEDFVTVCEKLHKSDIRIVLDGVFNHVGRGFWAFQDVLQNRENSRYRDWFHIDFGGNSNYNDGLWYEGWEGNFDLVKLNLQNEEVVQHIFDAVKYWIKTFDIDGLRLDVAYCLDRKSVV